MISWQETYQHMKADIKRRIEFDACDPSLLMVLKTLLRPGVWVVLLYRLSRFCFDHRLKIVCKLTSLMTQLISTSEISPEAKIDGGLVINDAGAIGITNAVVMGKNCTFMGLNSLTLGAMEHEPTEEDKIIVGDHCVFGTCSRVIRPVKLANGTQVMPSSVVITHTKKEGQFISGIPAKRKKQIPYEQIQQWNPMKGRAL